MKKNYTIGLDIGTNSVGYAVVLENNQLMRKNMKVLGNTDVVRIKKNFWGSSLFDAGKTAESTRQMRTNRRRQARRKKRIKELQCVFLDDMEQIDANFFTRLKDSFLDEEDKRGSSYPIFGTLDEEKNYHSNYPTIYHIRKELADSHEKADLRLIYLACAHILKYRGHFLLEGNLNVQKIPIQKLFDELIEIFNETFRDATNFEELSFENIQEELIKKVTRAKKVELVLSKYPKEKSNGVFASIIKLAIGNQANFKILTNLSEDSKLQISKPEYDEELESLIEIIGDDYIDLFDKVKQLYDAIELNGIITSRDLTTNAPLSNSMINRYQEHKEDLSKLKSYIKKYRPDHFDEIFKNREIDGYAGYIQGRVTEENFYKYMKKILGNDISAKYFINKIEQEEFLRKQRTYDNGAIPNQIHLAELKAIIENQSVYYPFLERNKERIIKIHQNRIPYYVGPINDGNSRFAWSSRISDTKMDSGNLEQVVDTEKSAVKFIERMTKKDTYLPDEDVLPKNSMIYQEFIIFNELTKLKYIDDQGKVNKFSGEQKQEIFNKLFKVERKVTLKKIENYLSNEYHIDSPTVTGMEEELKASFSIYHSLTKNIKGMKEVIDNPNNRLIVEDIIRVITIFEDRNMKINQLSRYSNILTNNMIKELARKKITGWGNLSSKLLVGIRDKRTGKTILDFLKEDGKLNRNFMQLINDRNLSFREYIELANKIEDVSYLYDLVKEISGSPAIKKGILQSLKIVDELIGIIGYEPENIVIEMSRENQTTARGKLNSKPRLSTLKEVYSKLDSDFLQLNELTNSELKNDELYLYYLQNGKDIYTGRPLLIDQLSSYDVDHIIPQSFTTDNSLDNRVLTSLKTNRGKSATFPSKEVVLSQKRTWEALLNSGAISKRKFNNLTRILQSDLTDREKSNFLNRQLVETRQITKHVARILDSRYNSGKENKEDRIKVVMLKSSLTNQFREEFEIFKVREVNDGHHAHDAYLNAVIAKTLLRVYPELEPEFVYGQYSKYKGFGIDKATDKKRFYSNVMKFFKEEQITNVDGEIVWDTNKDIPMIKKVLSSKQINIVKKAEVQKGELFDVNIVSSKSDKNPKGISPEKLTPIKKGLSVEKYGGYNKAQNATTIIIESKINGQMKKSVIGIRKMDYARYLLSPKDYLSQLNYLDCRVIAHLPKFTLYKNSEGYYRRVSTNVESHRANQLLIPENLSKLLYYSRKYVESNGAIGKDYISEHLFDYDVLFQLIIDFARKNHNNNVIEKLENEYNQKKSESLKDTAKSMLELLSFVRAGSTMSFQFFNQKVKQIQYRSKDKLDSTIIYKSVTGLYETQLDLRD